MLYGMWLWWQEGSVLLFDLTGHLYLMWGCAVRFGLDSVHPWRLRAPETHIQANIGDLLMNCVMQATAYQADFMSSNKI